MVVFGSSSSHRLSNVDIYTVFEIDSQSLLGYPLPNYLVKPFIPSMTDKKTLSNEGIYMLKRFTMQADIKLLWRSWIDCENNQPDHACVKRLC